SAQPEHKSEAVAATAVLDEPSSPSGGLRAGAVPPRTRAYAKEKGLSDHELSQLASRLAKVMPDDVDRFLADRAGTSDAVAEAPTERAPSTVRPEANVVQPEDVRSAGAHSPGYRDVPMAQRHRTLVYRLQQASRDVIPATMEIRLDWSPIEAARARLKENAAGPQPSQFLLFSWCVAQAAKNHPR